jgi:hypothetical protein
MIRYAPASLAQPHPILMSYNYSSNCSRTEILHYETDVAELSEADVEAQIPEALDTFELSYSTMKSSLKLQ